MDLTAYRKYLKKPVRDDFTLIIFKFRTISKEFLKNLKSIRVSHPSLDL
jgi:hypothetical protein